MSRYIIESRARGFGTEAAEAMARRRFREESEPKRVWSREHLEAERDQAEVKRKISAGQLMCCPLCKHFVPVSQGVILAHYQWDRKYHTPDGPCSGEGMLAESS